jgi:hypothetical protein
MGAIGIVCGYDLHADLERYVSSVAGRLEHESLDGLIVSGGRTSPVSHHSEAWVMASSLRKSFPELPIVLEERAMTTLDNLTFSREVAWERFEADRFVIFCDVAHQSKVKVLARMLLQTETSVRALPRSVPLRVRMFEPFSLVFEVLGALSPAIQRLVRAGAVMLKGLSSEQRRSVLRAAASSVEILHLPTRRFDTAAAPAQDLLPPTT